MYGVRAVATKSAYGFGAGFTLIETLVAVSILALSVTGPLFTAGRAIVAAEISRDQLTAAYLAQEGIDYVRAMRDDAYLSAFQAGGATISSTAWSNFVTLIAPCTSDKCQYDPFPGYVTPLASCSGGVCSSLVLYGGQYRPSQDVSGGEPTQFTRELQAITVSPNEMQVTSSVYWNFHTTPYKVTVVGHLTSWQ